MEDEFEIDLRKYLDVLVRRWRLILVLTGLAVLAAGLVSLVSPPLPYEATAGIAIVKTKTNVEFDSRFTTTSVDSAAAQAVDARRNALLGLAQNSAIAGQVIAELGERLEPAEHNPAVLMNKVQAEVGEKGRGDLILITVSDDDPYKAAAIANAWARVYERYINNLYGGAPTEYSASVQAELERARQEYEQAQAALEQSLAESHIVELSQQITQTWQILDGVLKQRLDALNQELGTETSILKDYYAQKVELGQLLGEAGVLRAQVAQGGDASARSNSLALVLLKAKAFASAPGLSVSLQWPLGDAGSAPSASEQIADLEALIHVLQQRQTQVDAEIARRVQALQTKKELESVSNTSVLSATTPTDQMVGQYAAQLAQASSALEREQARQEQLTQQRDLARETYVTLARKQAEVNIASAVMSSEVRFAAPAIPPNERPARGTARNLALAGAVGLILGIVAVFGIDYLGEEILPQTLLGHPRLLWNRAFRWIVTAGPGLPDRAA